MNGPIFFQESSYQEIKPPPPYTISCWREKWVAQFGLGYLELFHLDVSTDILKPSAGHKKKTVQWQSKQDNLWTFVNGRNSRVEIYF